MDPRGWLSRANHRHPVGLPVVLGLVAAAFGLAVVLGDNLRGVGPGPAEPGRVGPGDRAAAASPAQPLGTRPFVHPTGGFRIQVPAGLSAARDGHSARFTSRGKNLVISVGPTPSGSLSSASEQLLARIMANYQQVRVTDRHQQTINGRAAIMTAGLATNSSDVELRFLTVLLAADGRNLGMSVFTARDSDPAMVLPRVNALVNTLEPLPRRRPSEASRGARRGP